MKRQIAAIMVTILTTLAPWHLQATTGQPGMESTHEGSINLQATEMVHEETAKPKRMAVVEFSESHLREEADYTAELGTQALMGTIVEIIAEEGYWRKVVTPEPYTAWCTDMGLVEMSDEAIKEYEEADKYICVVPFSAIREKPADTAQKISDMGMGCLTRIVYRQTKKGQKKVVKGQWAQVLLPSGKTGWAPSKDIKEYKSWMQSRNGSAPQIIKTARMFLGTPYLWGGASAKGLDCSGLTRLTFYMNGIMLPRNASQQAKTGREIIVETDHSIPVDSYNFKAEMLKRIKNLKPGDLLFFGTPGNMLKKDRITHVGIYIGNGKFIHSSQIVRINSLLPDQEDYYENSHKFLKARRY